MKTKQVLLLAAVLGAFCGLLELYQSITFVEDIKRGGTNVVRGVFIFIVPAIIIAAAASIYFGRIIIGTGTIIASLGIQHYLVTLEARHLLGFACGLGAVAVALYVQRQRDEEQLQKEGEIKWVQAP